MQTYEGLYQSYYKRIADEIEYIKTSNEFEKKSQAFAYWYLNNVEGFDSNTTYESITDGHNDWGIDAIVIDEENLLIRLYQFKFPDKVSNLNKKVNQEDIASFLRGYAICSSGKVPSNANKELKRKVLEIMDSNIYSFKLSFISYTDGLSETAEITLEQELEKIKSTGNKIDWTLLDKESITNFVFEQNTMKDDYKIKLRQHGTSTGVYTDESTKTYIIYASLKELADISGEYNDIIFDENVRLYEGIKNKFNKGILDTASGNDVNNFHLYNNGIVIVSPSVTNVDLRKEVIIHNPMIVNGCQTMNSLLEAKNRESLKDGVVQVTIIEVTEPEVKRNISIYLNSQTEIKDSYLISNLPIIRALEKDIEDLGYFFERQANNLELLKKRLSRREKVELLGVNNSKAIELDLAMQLQASFYENLAPVAKSNKSKLFESKNLDKILTNIEAERVVFAFEIYNKIMEKVSDYRSYRRNDRNKNIIEYLNINENEIDNYLFINTGDFFLLSLFSEISQIKFGNIPELNQASSFDFNTWKNNVNENFDEIFIEGIDVMRDCVKNDKSGKQIATLTKSLSFHKELLKALHQAK